MGTSVSRAILAHLRNIVAVLLTALLAFTLVPCAAFAADGVGVDAAAPSEGSHAEEGEGAFGSEVPDAKLVLEGGASPQPPSPSSNGGSGIAASALIGKPTAFVSADVALGDDAEPVVGSFTVDGMTFALSGDGATLVAVAPAEDPEGALGSEVPDAKLVPEGGTSPRPPSGSSAIPSTAAYDGVAYDVTAIGAYAFYLSGATEASLPASVASVDDRAFRSSDVAWVDVDPANPNIASFDGCLYDSQLKSLLLIPEGRAGAILLPKTAEVVEAGKFSHCSLVDAISVEEGGAAFASWDGLLYDADGTVLLRVPAGATDITIREGCATIAAGAMEGCARLESINAPSTVTSISPDVFASVPTVSLPAASLVEAGDAADSDGIEEGDAPQLTAKIAFAPMDDRVLEVDPSSIEAVVTNHDSEDLWRSRRFKVLVEASSVQLSSAATYAAGVTLNGNGGTVHRWDRYATGTVDPYSEETKRQWLSQQPSASGSSLTWNASGFPSSNGFFGTGSGDSNSPYYNNFSVWFRAYKYVNGVLCWNGGWATSPNGPLDSGFAALGSVRYARWLYRVSFVDELHETSTTTVEAGASAMAPSPSMEGKHFAGWYSVADPLGENGQLLPGGQSTGRIYDHTTYRAKWISRYTVDFDVNAEGGGAPEAPATITPLVGESVVLPSLSRPGYMLKSWATDAGGAEVEGAKEYLPGEPVSDLAGPDETITLYAQWTPIIDADLPSSVTARVDLLDIEDQAEAVGHIKSLCGEALKVAKVECVPRAGAASLFGSHAKEVSLEVFAGTSGAPTLSFALDATRSEADAPKLSAFLMPSLGDAVPIRYRFDIPKELLPSLVETEAAICQVSYTVALA